MTAPYKVDMATESVISYMAARIAALEAENAELKTRINDLATDWQVLRLKLETAREALVAARHMIYYEDAPLGWNITRLDEALAAIGEAQPETLPTIGFNRNGATMAEFPSSKCQFPKPASFDVAKSIHYPECWDTACYPTIADAIREIAAFRCTNDDCAQPASAEVKP